MGNNFFNKLSFLRFDDYNNTILICGGGLILTFLYKIWRILQRDSRIDNLESISQQFRNEIRIELHDLKIEQETLKAENIKLHNEIFEIKASLKICQKNHPATCPLFNYCRENNGK